MATRVKRYEAPLDHFDALLAQIESEMGPDARLETREFRRGGVLGVGGQRMVEVVASVNVDVLAGAAPKRAGGPAPLSAANPHANSPQPRWASPGISIQADGPALPFDGESRQPARIAPLLSELHAQPQAVHLRPASSSTNASAPSSRVEQQLAILKNELARLQRAESESAAQVNEHSEGGLVLRRDSAARLSPQQDEISELRASVQELAASVRQIATVRQPGQSRSQLEHETQQRVELLAPAQSMASQGGGGSVTARNSAGGRGSQGAASAGAELEDYLSKEAASPGKPAAAEPDERAGLWEVVEPMRAGKAQQTVSAAADEPIAEELDMPALPSTARASESELDAVSQLEQVKQRTYLRLLNSNIDSSHALDLLEAAASELASHIRIEDASSELLEEALLTEIQGEICREILIGGGIDLRGGLPGKVVALVGPTGVGKSTMLAKLAAHFAFQRGRSVGLVSLDTHRIAAAEQLKTYAEIMGLPIQVVYSHDEFDEALTAARARYELTLVDTAGASPLGGKQLKELAQAFSLHKPDEVHLVLSATTKADDLRLVLENFRILDYSRLILSKLDETRGLGALYNVNRYASAPISYFAVGQGVPEDLRVAGLDFIQHWVTTGAVK